VARAPSPAFCILPCRAQQGIPIVTKFLVKTPKCPESPQLPHSIPKINFAKVSSRSPSICHNRSRIVKRSTGGWIEIFIRRISDGRSESDPSEKFSVRRILALFSTKSSDTLPPADPIDSQAANGRLLTHDFDHEPLRALAVELGVKHALPWPQVKLAVSNR
jgi:hypothetical protein